MTYSKETNTDEAVIKSFLDTDLYKISMQAAVHINFPDSVVEYRFNNRSIKDKKFNQEAIDWLETQFALLANLRFTKEEIDYLRNTLPYLPEKYLTFLSNDFKLDPKNEIHFSNTKVAGTDDLFDLVITIKGKWEVTILYEIYVLALVSEAYFKFVDIDWDHKGQKEQSFQKAAKLFENGVAFSEFGTRRRRDFKTQELVIQGIVEASNSKPEYKSLLLGTSNVLLAKNHNLRPIGTVAHEWFMGIASLKNDYLNSNKIAMEYWVSTFGPENAGLALTDTFGTDIFLKNFEKPLSDYYIGVRQDSGDPKVYTDKISNHYLNHLKYEPFSKSICFSDSLNVEKCLELNEYCHSKQLNCNFGIGTFFTNDFRTKSSNYTTKSEPLNIVIKIMQIDNNNCIKISDNLGKNMGDADTLLRVKKELGYVDKEWTGVSEEHRWKE